MRWNPGRIEAESERLHLRWSRRQGGGPRGLAVPAKPWASKVSTSGGGGR